MLEEHVLIFDGRRDECDYIEQNETHLEMSK